MRTQELQILRDLNAKASEFLASFPRLVERATGALVDAALIRPRLKIHRPFWRLAGGARVSADEESLAAAGLETRKIVFPAVTNGGAMAECPEALEATRRLMEIGHTCGTAHGFVAGALLVRAGVRKDPQDGLALVEQSLMPAEFLRGVAAGHEAGRARQRQETASLALTP